jgi:protoporphyrinogen oxidase
MKVAIIGAGFTGLTAALNLLKGGADVVIYESLERPGGLATGFKEKEWEWGLEEYYHHFFVSDKKVLNLAEEVGQIVDFKSPISSTYLDGGIFQLDTPISLLKFKKLSFVERLRTGVVVAFLKITPFWKPLERITAYEFIRKYMGENSWKTLWEPLFGKKFGQYEKQINAAWFWARIKKRSARLGYPRGGFLEFARKVEKVIMKNGGKFFYDTRVISLERKGGKIVVVAGSKPETFDKVVCTLSSKQFLSITKNLPKDYVRNLSELKNLGTINMALSLKNTFLDDGSYWLNVNEDSFPFLAIIEHTNFIDRKYYGGEHLLYVANYLSAGHKYFTYSNEELLKEYLPYLKGINKKINESWINKTWVFKSFSTQPVVEVNRSKILPALETPIEGLYLSNMEQVYPWDRGTNYSVELGEKVAELVLKSK